MPAGKYFEAIQEHIREAKEQVPYPYGVATNSIGPGLLWKINDIITDGLSVEEACLDILGPARCRYPTPGTIREAYAYASKDIATECNTKDNVNLSSIATILIQNVGRFAEAYASDFIIDWDTVRRLIREAEPGDDSIVTFGIRKCGVDHTQYLMNRLQPAMRGAYICAERYYRRIFGLRIRMNEMSEVKATLRDLTNSFLHYHQEDYDWKSYEHEL